MSFTRPIATLIVAAAALPGAASASLVDLPLIEPAAEAVLFEDDFDNNNAGWTLADTNFDNNPDAQITGGELGPVLPRNKTTMSASLAFAPADQPDLADGLVRIGFRTRSTYKSSNGSEFGGRIEVLLGIASADELELEIRPQSFAAITGDKTDGTGTGRQEIDADAGTGFDNAGSWVNYTLELELDPNDSNLLIARFYTFDANTSQWQLGGTLGGLPGDFYDAGTGRIESLELYARNDTGAGYFDAVRVSQIIPEPGSAALVALAAVGFLISRRSRI